MPHAHRTRRSTIAVVAILSLLLAAVPFASAGTGNKAKKLHLTAVVKKEVENGSKGDRVVISLLSGEQAVGGIVFPGCAGAGTSVSCGGTVSIAGLGSNLNTLVTFECPAVAPFKCKPGVGLLEAKGGATKGSITLKVEPSKLEPGLRFPVIVVEGK